jgi:hypothetical protein
MTAVKQCHEHGTKCVLQINVNSTSRTGFCPVSNLLGYNYNISVTSGGI